MICLNPLQTEPGDKAAENFRENLSRQITSRTNGCQRNVMITECQGLEVGERTGHG